VTLGHVRVMGAGPALNPCVEKVGTVCLLCQYWIYRVCCAAQETSMLHCEYIDRKRKISDYHVYVLRDAFMKLDNFCCENAVHPTFQIVTKSCQEFLR